MSWGLSFRIRQYLKGSLWILPLAGGAVGVLGAIAAADTGTVFELPAGWQYSASTANAVLAAVVSASIGLTGFVVTVSVLVVQMATGTFSARYMRLVYRDGVLKAVLAVLIGTFAYSYGLLRRIEGDDVPNFGVTLAGVFMGIGVILFVVFLDRFVHRLRPVAVAALVARAGRDAFEEVVAEAAAVEALDVTPSAYEASGGPALAIRTSRAGAIQAIDTQGLVEWARGHGCLVVLRHPVGDFVPAGATVIEVYGSAPDGPLAERRLGAMIATGVERTIEQDPAFALRVMVDVAIRALSPAVNDPTTAVQVLDHLEDLLGVLGREAPTERPAARWDGRTGGVVVPMRSWDDYLVLAITEIREFGATSIQVVRRLRALLESLREAVHPDHRAEVDEQLARLEATVAEHWGGTPDADLARVPDRQGIGGPGPGRPA